MYLKTAIILGISIQITSVIYLVFFLIMGLSSILHTVNPLFSLFIILYQMCVNKNPIPCVSSAQSP